MAKKKKELEKDPTMDSMDDSGVVASDAEPLTSEMIEPDHGSVKIEKQESDYKMHPKFSKYSEGKN